MLLFLMLACAHDNVDEVLADIDSAVDAVDVLTEDHGGAVAAATTPEAITAAEGDLATLWPIKMSDLRDALDMIGDCAMDDADTADLDDARLVVDDLDVAATGHADAMAATTVEEAQAIELEFGGTTSDLTDQLRADRGGWDDGSVECSMNGMKGM